MEGIDSYEQYQEQKGAGQNAQRKQPTFHVLRSHTHPHQISRASLYKLIYKLATAKSDLPASQLLGVRQVRWDSNTEQLVIGVQSSFEEWPRV